MFINALASIEDEASAAASGAATTPVSDRHVPFRGFKVRRGCFGEAVVCATCTRPFRLNPLKAHPLAEIIARVAMLIRS